MINNEILSFIKDQIARGTTKDTVKEMLVSEGGWDDKDVEEAFETINFSGTSYPSVLKNAEVLEAKGEKKDNTSFLEHGPAKTISNDVNPTEFPPGLSHREQPKVMEPSMQGSAVRADTAPFSGASGVKPMNNAPSVSYSRPNNATGGDTGALSGLRARIASGVSDKSDGLATAPASVSRPTIQAVITQPTVSSSYPQPFIMTPDTSPVSVVPTTPITENRNGGFPVTAGVSSLLPSLNKTAATPSPVRPFTPSPEHLAVFPKSTMGGVHISQGSAKFAPIQAQKQRGGRFLLGLLMFLIGLAIGGISMNAYMKGYVKTDAFNGIIEKGMDLIGLGTVTAPVPEASPIPAKTRVIDTGS